MRFYVYSTVAAVHFVIFELLRFVSGSELYEKDHVSGYCCGCLRKRIVFDGRRQIMYECAPTSPKTLRSRLKHPCAWNIIGSCKSCREKDSI